MEQEINIEVSGATQDEALANARKVAAEKGYQDVSLKNIISITYHATLYNPIKKEEPVLEAPEAGTPTE